jgi:hypothetical protein
MEPLWSPVVATGGNRSQIGSVEKPLKQGKTVLLVATSCRRRDYVNPVTASMVRRGLRFESGRGLEIPANQLLLLPDLIAKSTSL